MIEILGYLAALLIGLILGLMGGGGSIVTVPVLVYIMGYSPVIATGYSLFVIGATAIAGTIMYWNRKLVHLKTAISFGIPTALAVYLTRHFLVPAIPEAMFDLGFFIITRDFFLMNLFAVLMILASFSMIRKDKRERRDAKHSVLFSKNIGIVIQGLAIGLLTGLVGVGGGFMIVPALVILLGMEMKAAVGTSLFIMAANSMIGFLGEISSGAKIDWLFLILFASISIVGIIIGNRLSKKVEGDSLRISFRWFVFTMGVFIVLNEVWFKL